MSKPQSKTQKKIDNNVRKALTLACEKILDDVAGFQWLTHQANYTNFPASLFVTCVFDTDSSLQDAGQQGATVSIQKLIQTQLLKIGVKFKSVSTQVVFDTEQACEQQHAGDWSQRLAGRDARAVSRFKGEF
jgi:hypothetical protein